MTSTIKINDFLLTNVNDTQLISVPSTFTSNEVNFLKQLLQKNAEDYKNNSLNKSHSNLRKIFIDFGKTTFINNDGLIGLCQIIKLAEYLKINLSFISFSVQVKMILSLVGLDRIPSLEN